MLMHRQRRSRNKAQRGAAAVEFALVFPTLIALLGMMVAVGNGLKARHQMLNLAAASARYCTFQQPTDATAGNMTACVQSYVNFVTTSDAANNMPPCTNINAAVTSKPAGSGVNAGMSYLVVEMSCTASWVPIVSNAAEIITLPGTSYQVVAKSSMPYMAPQLLFVGPPT